jgi:sugar transferase (PEP-CTERM/EpsH1 system associated)
VDSRIHIQHVLLSLQPGGLENGVVNVVNRLDSREFRSSVCCLKHAGEFRSRITGEETRVYEMGWRGGNDFALPLKLARLFRETRPDIVHTRNAESYFYGFLGAKLAGVPCIIHSEHGRTFNDRKIRFAVQRWFSKYTNSVFAVSERLRRDLVKYTAISAGKIDVLYNGVDLKHFKPVAREELRHRLEFRPSDIVVGSVGRLVAVKNYSLLLRAVKAMANNNVVVVLIGEGSERAALEAQALALGLNERVRFFGHRDDVAELLVAMDIFVLPSLSEGMSNTQLEAMAAGVAVVASDVGGNAEIVQHGVNGLIFPNGDEVQLCKHLNALAANACLRAELAKAGRDRVLSGFTIDAMIRRYEHLYRTTLLKRREYV